MASMNYYFCPKNNFNYCFVITEDNQPHLYVNPPDENEWTHWPVKAARFLTFKNYYKLFSSDLQTKAYLHMPVNSIDKPCLVFKNQSLAGNTSEMLFYLEKMDLLSSTSEAVADEQAIAAVPSHSEAPERLSELQDEQFTASEPVPNRLSDTQRKALEEHLSRLQTRHFEYRLLSYFFKTGYSRTEKIREISNLLEGHDINTDILHQGRTGKILKGL